MNNTVKNVFLMLMGTVVAVVLYYIFFGSVNLAGDDLKDMSTGQQQLQGTEWMGLIHYMSASVELSMSRYYYEYCYLPAIHKNDALDVDLINGDSSGLVLDTSDSIKRVNDINLELYGLSSTAPNSLTNTNLFQNAMQNTPSDTSVDLIVDKNKVTYYTTGWY